jgi:hypothetical protein
MQTFGRLLPVLTFLLSVGFMAQALPAAARSGALSVRDYSSPEYSSHGYNSPAGYNNGNDKYTSPHENGGYSGSKGGINKNIDVLALVTDLKVQLDPKVALLGMYSHLRVC